MAQDEGVLPGGRTPSPGTAARAKMCCLKGQNFPMQVSDSSFVEDSHDKL
jgi:hypothetical protein